MDLVLQGSEIDTRDLKRIAKAAGAQGIEQTSPGVFRLTAAATAAAVEPLCVEARIDCAWVPHDRRLADFRLLVLDMDSTLITIETIDELADMVGLKAEVAAVTERAMRGELEFSESLRQRVAVLEGLEASALERVYAERVRLTPGADRLLARSQALGIKTLLVSGGFTYVAERLQARLGLDYTRANTLEIEHGRLTGSVVGDIVDANGKRDALIEVRERLGATREQTIAIGDGANDLAFMAEAGVSIAFRAKPVVRARATHALNHVGLDGVLHLFN